MNARPLRLRAVATAVALAASLALAAPATAAADTTPAPQTVVKTGHMAGGTPPSTYLYVPFDVPAGVSKLSFHGEYTNQPATALDIAVFDNDGHGFDDDAGFRGSSGGDWSDFYIAASSASDSYIPGPIEPGTWYVMLSPYRIAAQGTDWSLTVTMDFGPPGQPFTPEPYPRTVNTTPGWYRCDDHVHSTQSGGVHTPPAWTMAEEVQAAVDRGLDCFFSTDYYTTIADLTWGKYQRPDFLVVPGEEAVTRFGHLGTAGQVAGNWIDYRYRPQDHLLEQAVQDVHVDGGIAIANHPMTGCFGCSWQFPYTPVDEMEVWNGVWQSDDEQALQTWDGMLRWGRHITATGGSDAHNGPGIDSHPIGEAQTVVRASGLSVDGIMQGIKAGHAYVADNSNVDMALQAATTDGQTAGIGDPLAVGHLASVDVTLRVQGAPGAVATLHTQDGVVATEPVQGDDATVTWHTTPDESQYVRAEVRRPDGTMVEFSNPIWLGHAPNEQPVATLGTPDGSAQEFALWPNRYSAYTTTFPRDVDFTVGEDDPARDWSYIQPGPQDSFAGNRAHPFTLRFQLPKAPPRDLAFRAWLVDTPANRTPFYPASMHVTVNGADAGTQALEPGVHSGDGYHWGDGSLSFGGVYSRVLTFTLPKEALHAGENAVTVTLPTGSWVVWDAAGVFTTPPASR